MKERIIKFIKRIPIILLAGIKQFCRGLYRIGKMITDYSQRVEEPRRTETRKENKIEMPKPIEIKKRVNNTKRTNHNHDFLKPSGFCDTNLNNKSINGYDMFSQSNDTKPSGEI